METTIKVLIVDDHKLISEAWTSLLKDAPNIWVVGTADNAEDAFSMTHAHKPDIVLMDILMPELDGLSTTRIIRDKESTVLQHDIPIIALTANAFEQAKKEIFESGMNAFVSKPLVPELLHEKLKSLTQDKN